jgi:FLVCR family feline leukemia virus subgroup C receptor-related protein
MISAICVVLLFYPALLTSIKLITYIAGFLIGFFLVPMVPVMMELCCEIIYPLNGSFAIGILLSGATIVVIISSQILTIITRGTSSDRKSCLKQYFLLSVS